MGAESLKLNELTDLTIETLGKAEIESPLVQGSRQFFDDGEKILVYSHSESFRILRDSTQTPPMFERAGPRRKLFFDPKKLNCGIVTCGIGALEDRPVYPYRKPKTNHHPQPRLAVRCQERLWFSIWIYRPVLQCSDASISFNAGPGRGDSS